MGKTKVSNAGEEEDFGQPYSYDPDFDGIEKERKCTDCFCSIFFILFICGMIALFVISLTRSNYKYIYIPTDSRGLLCGYNNKDLKVDNSNNLPDLTKNKYLFWIRPGRPGFSRSFCVSDCPTKGYFSNAYKSLNDKLDGFNTSSTVCGNYNNQPIYPSIENYSEPNTNPDRFYCPYSTKVIMQRCFPTTEAFQDIKNSSGIEDTVKEFGASSKAANYATQAIEDIYHTYWIIALCVVASLVLSLIWILLLRCLAAVFVWITVILCAGALGVLTWMTYRQWKNDFGNHSTIEKYTFGFVSEELNQKVFLIFFIIMIVIDVIYILLVIFLFKRIVLSIKIIKFVSKTFGKVPSLFFFPVIQYIILLVFWVYVIGVAIVLFGAGKFERKIEQFGNNPPVDKIIMKYDTLIQGFAIYHFVGFLWISFFIMALGEMTVSGVVAQYYFTSDKDSLPCCKVTRSFFRALRYHTGSLALGSLIITIFKIIRIIIEYVDQKTKASQSDLAACVIKCCKCCLCCLEKFLKFLNRNAYTMIAIHGYNFWNGAKNAFMLIVRNVARVATLNWVGDFTLFLGRIFVSAGITAFSLWLFKRNKDVQFYIVPTVITFVMCYFASGAFTSIYEMAIDATFLCYMEDCERNDGVANQRLAGEELSEMLEKKDDDSP